MEYCSTINSNKLLILVAVSINLKAIMLSERGQIQKAIYIYTIPHLQDFLEKAKLGTTFQVVRVRRGFDYEGMEELFGILIVAVVT